MPFDRVVYIVNPASQNGATARRWPQMRALLPEAHEVLHTHSPREATTLAKRAGEAGADLVVSVGGDGTLNEVANGLMQLAPDKRPALGMLPLGTGGDFRRTIGYSTDPGSVGVLLKRGHTRSIDVGSVSYNGHSGEREVRYFVNIASFGMSGVVVPAVNETSKVLGGKLSFIVGTLRGLWRYRPVEVELSLDDAPFSRRRIYLVAVCNGRAFGGGMLLAPTADPSDGVFDVVVMDPRPIGSILLDLRKIYSGSHLGGAGMAYTSAKRIYARSDEAVYLEADGEALGTLPIEIEILPKALQLVC